MPDQKTGISYDKSYAMELKLPLLIKFHWSGASGPSFGDAWENRFKFQFNILLLWFWICVNPCMFPIEPDCNYFIKYSLKSYTERKCHRCVESESES